MCQRPNGRTDCGCGGDLAQVPCHHFVHGLLPSSADPAVVNEVRTAEPHSSGGSPTLSRSTKLGHRRVTTTKTGRDYKPSAPTATLLPKVGRPLMRVFAPNVAPFGRDIGSGSQWRALGSGAADDRSRRTFSVKGGQVRSSTNLRHHVRLPVPLRAGATCCSCLDVPKLSMPTAPAQSPSEAQSTVPRSS